MPQVQLPIFPEGSTPISAELAFTCRDGQVVYLNGHLPVFIHPKEDLAAFRFFTSQLLANGTVTQVQIVKAFGVPLTTVKRYVRTFHQGGAKAFFSPPAPRHGHRLTPELLLQTQGLLDQAWGVAAVARELGVLASTIHKAIAHGRLKPAKKKTQANLPRK